MNRIYILLIIVAVLIGIGAWYFYSRPGQETGMAIGDAITIAKTSSCSDKGTIGSQGVYNAVTKTWWIEFTPNASNTKSGCNPACVVSEDSRSAEINWRCTGAIPPASN
ncbi:MAG TPA: hypothetical protein VFQ60_01540 [Patescibacteria group bacterium]|nr:hypothetical protein [Patescibacteria group bacterium]